MLDASERSFTLPRLRLRSSSSNSTTLASMIVKSITVSLPSLQAVVDIRFPYRLTLGLSVWSLFQAATSHLTPKISHIHPNQLSPFAVLKFPFPPTEGPQPAGLILTPCTTLPEYWTVALSSQVVRITAVDVLAELPPLTNAYYYIYAIAIHHHG
jgi:hypothetical protein